MVQLTLYGGVGQIGGNKILLEDDWGVDRREHSVEKVSTCKVNLGKKLECQEDSSWRPREYVQSFAFQAKYVSAVPEEVQVSLH